MIQSVSSADGSGESLPLDTLCCKVTIFCDTGGGGGGGGRGGGGGVGWL